jgi:phosphohistidine phosphatase SixA
MRSMKTSLSKRVSETRRPRVLGRARPHVLAGIVAAVAALSCPQASPQTLSGKPLVEALRQGGYVLVMRHAHSPHASPRPEDAAPGNSALERQLDEPGRASAVAMGRALEQLDIPIAEVLSSPTFRARQTVRFLGLEPETVTELGDGGQGMKADTEGKRSAWLRMRAAQKPPAGTNTLIVTHLPNLVGAFGEDAEGTGDGETLIVRPTGAEAVVVGRVAIDEWPKLTAD